MFWYRLSDWLLQFPALGELRHGDCVFGSSQISTELCRGPCHTKPKASKEFSLSWEACLEFIFKAPWFIRDPDNLWLPDLAWFVCNFHCQCFYCCWSFTYDYGSYKKQRWRRLKMSFQQFQILFCVILLSFI